MTNFSDDMRRASVPCPTCPRRMLPGRPGCFVCVAVAGRIGRPRADTAKQSERRRAARSEVMCRHCEKKPKSKARGLCAPCYANLEIRALYPAAANQYRAAAAPTAGPQAFAKELARVQTALLLADVRPALRLCKQIAEADADGDLSRLLAAARRLQRAGKLEAAANLLGNMAEREALR